jgi:hypothetical protein
MGSNKRAFKFPVSVLVGSKPCNIMRVVNGYKIDLKYYPKFILSLVVSFLLELLHLPERIFRKRKPEVVREIEPPVFIIGFWRSGTTLLHSLLCQDPKAGYVTTFQGVFPNLVLSRFQWLKEFTNRFLPKERPFDSYPMDMDFPQEEEFALMSLQPKSLYRFFYFPKDLADIYENDLYFERMPAVYRKRWEKEYLNLINNAMLNTCGERYMSKNPCNIFRITTLKDLFPDARFIFIYRDPYLVVESLFRFAHKILPGSELQHLEEGMPREQFAKLYRDSINEYNRVKESISPANLVEIKYEEFKDRPLEFLRDIYKRFNIPGFEDALPFMETYLAKNSHPSRTAYQVDPETFRLVNKYARDIVQNLGYQAVESEK